MSMDGVDISGYDVPIDVVGLTADFVIVKVTEGLQGDRYNKWWRDMLNEGAQGGKCLGCYHYANGEDPIAEADSFYSYIKEYRGRIVPCLDWEGQGNDLFGTGRDVTWCRQFLDRIASLTGATPMLYTSKSECNAYDWSSVASRYPLWGAEYAYDDYTYDGYEDEPWQSRHPWGAWGVLPKIHQYGYVNPRPNNGGQGQLDADKFYGTREEWLRMCGGGGSVDLRSKVVERVRSHLGEPYNSMDDGEDGWGCAMLCKDALNFVLGTNYYGSVYNFAGDALGQSVNQGGGEFVFTDNPQAGDVVIYMPAGYSGTDYDDYGHAALYVGDGMVIGAWGKGNIGQAGYWPGRGVSEDAVEDQSLGGGWRYIRCTRLDIAPKPKDIKDAGKGAVYRLYDRSTGAHFFTANLDEARSASVSMDYEGVGWYVSGKGQEVYRLYDKSNGDRFYTANPAERDSAKGFMDYEGVAFKTDGDVPVHRLYDKEKGLHIFTSSKQEMEALRGGMTYEGIAFYAIGDKDGVKVKQPDSKPKNSNGFKYRAHSQSAGWLPAVRDGQTAGTEGYAKRMEALGITPPEGMVIDAYCHVQGIGNLYYDGVKGKGVTIGTTGQARRMEAIRLVVTKWPDALKGKKLRYQGHVQGVGWDKVCSEGQWCGTRGKGKRLEAVRIWIE